MIDGPLMHEIQTAAAQGKTSLHDAPATMTEQEFRWRLRDWLALNKKATPDEIVLAALQLAKLYKGEDL